MNAPAVLNGRTLDLIADQLCQEGYVILRSCFSDTLLEKLQQHVKALPLENWHQAGIGRHQNHHQDVTIRSDQTHWINRKNLIESEFLDVIETLRMGLNQRLFMGLFDYEGHFSTYTKGAFYQKHTDSLKGQKNRILSQVLYLNPGWKKEDAGELVLYSKDTGSHLQTISPQLGTLVLFLSEQFPHEVLKTNRTRYSLTGWFRLKQ